MPSVALTKAAITTLGVDPNLQAIDAVNGNNVANSAGRTFLLVRNPTGGALTITAAIVTASRPADGTFPATTATAIAKAVAAGGFAIIGPFPACYQDANGLLQITYSGAGLTVAPFDVN